MRATYMGIASTAVAVGLALSLGACVTVGGSGVADPGTVTDASQGTSDGNGKMSVNGIIVGDAPESTSSPVPSGDSAGTSADDAQISPSRTSSSSKTPSASMSNFDIVGRWECATVWANGNKRTAAEAGQSGDYYEFHSNGTVTAHISGTIDDGTYALSGTQGSITYPKSPDDSYNEVFEVNPTTDGTSWAMKVNFKGVAPENFRVYKKVSDSSSSASGATSTSAAPSLDYDLDYDDYDDIDSGYGSSSSSSSDSDTPAPGTVVDGWKWV